MSLLIEQYVCINCKASTVYKPVELPSVVTPCFVERNVNFVHVHEVNMSLFIGIIRTICKIKTDKPHRGFT